VKGPELTEKQRRVIDQWKKDLVDPLGPRFNLDFPIRVFEGTDALRFEGDPGMFLAYHFADIESDEDLADWMSTHRSEDIISFFTGIPLVDAKALIEPKCLWDVDYDTHKITASQFIDVLDQYLATGFILWQKVLMDEQRV
jgi:hypothetical protein